MYLTGTHNHLRFVEHRTCTTAKIALRKMILVNPTITAHNLAHGVGIDRPAHKLCCTLINQDKIKYIKSKALRDKYTVNVFEIISIKKTIMLLHEDVKKEEDMHNFT
jgi:hypothetical protein